MAARKFRGTKDVPWQQYHRDKIKIAELLARMEAFVLGKPDPQCNKKHLGTAKPVQMSPAQVAAGLGLIRKVIPDLSNVEANVTHRRDPVDLTDDELAEIVARTRGDGAAEPASGPAGSDRVH